ncbi:MAG TPA: hypothetical protein V6D17_05035 [Candidatus Obscuribacterales bacterium]
MNNNNNNNDNNNKLQTLLSMASAQLARNYELRAYSSDGYFAEAADVLRSTLTDSKEGITIGDAKATLWSTFLTEDACDLLRKCAPNLFWFWKLLRNSMIYAQGKGDALPIDVQHVILAIEDEQASALTCYRQLLGRPVQSLAPAEAALLGGAGYLIVSDDEADLQLQWHPVLLPGASCR